MSSPYRPVSEMSRAGVAARQQRDYALAAIVAATSFAACLAAAFITAILLISG